MTATENDSPAALPKRSWWAVLKRTAKEFVGDDLPDRAAALTYYGILSLFPAMLLLVSVLGFIGESATRTLLDGIKDLAPGPTREILGNAVGDLQDTGGAGGILAVFAFAGALWSASGYVAAFMRASNSVYDLPEGRPLWKLTPVRIGLTVLLMLLSALSATIVVFTGPLAEKAGGLIGLGDQAVLVWDLAKWPVLILLVALMIALLYWAAPNVRGRGLRWISPGSFLAVALWIAASAGFALYVANFGSYNRTYGTLAGPIVFLAWLWLTNLAILLGLEFDAELARERAITDGHEEGDEPYVEPRDTRAWPRALRRKAAERKEREEREERRQAEARLPQQSAAERKEKA